MIKSNKTFFGLICLFFILISCSSGPSKRMKESPNFKDGKFVNTGHMEKKSFWAFLGMRMKTKWNDWPDWVEVEQNENIDERIAGTRVTFINHATMLLQTKNVNILTDPIFSKRCSPVSWTGPKRVHDPGVAFDKLPKIDIVVISHDHYDHLDLPSIEKLISRDNPKIFVGLGVKRRIENNDNVVEMDWWETHEIREGFKIHFTEVQHFSGRSLSDRNTTLWGAYVIEIEGQKIYFGGDSGYHTHYTRTFEKYGAMDLSFIPIGAYAPRSFMKRVHLNPEEAVQAHLDLKSKKSFGIHYGTFHLTAELRDEPLEKLKEEIVKRNLSEEEFIALQPGSAIDF